MNTSIKILLAEGFLSQEAVKALTGRGPDDKNTLQVVLPVVLSDLSVRKAQMRFLASLEMSLSSGKFRAFLWFMILL